MAVTGQPITLNFKLSLLEGGWWSVFQRPKYVQHQSRYVQRTGHLNEPSDLRDTFWLLGLIIDHVAIECSELSGRCLRGL